MQSWLTSIFQLIDSSEASSSEPTRQKLLVDEEQHSKHSYSSPQSECMVDIYNVGYNYHDEESGIVAFPTHPRKRNVGFVFWFGAGDTYSSAGKA